jgi:hypothetical protein
LQQKPQNSQKNLLFLKITAGYVALPGRTGPTPHGAEAGLSLLLPRAHRGIIA